MIDTEKYHNLLRLINPKYIRLLFPIEKCPIPLIGEDIKRHLRNSESVLICAATLGEVFDRLLRQLQVDDMAGAVFLDSLAGEYLEKFIDNSDRELTDERKLSMRYSPGYGDFPLSVNRDIIEVLNASTRIGLCVTDDYILTPQKSITGLIGVRA
ncbi:MAG: hypothetical protein FWF94_02400 [Oscillospiraceae bacterium]|nr:hypothetical protein [Oscillospiraceae bacterium]